MTKKTKYNIRDEGTMFALFASTFQRFDTCQLI